MNKKISFSPPMKNGVTASQVFLPKNFNFQTVYDFLTHQFPHIPTEEWQSRFTHHLIFNQYGENLTLTTPYLHEQHIFYYRELKQEIVVPFSHEIIFENQEFMVVDKPHFLTVSPTGQYVQQTLLTRLKQETQNPDLTPIHRLDRETAGLILISKNPKTRGIYQQLFAEKKVKKIYHAIAPYRTDLTFPRQFSAHLCKGEPFYTMQIIDKPANSFTEIEILEHNQHWAKYKLTPITGKQHQLRVHMNALDLPLKNDRFYPEVRHDDENFEQPLQLLAKEITFIDPISQQNIYFYSKRDLFLG